MKSAIKKPPSYAPTRQKRDGQHDAWLMQDCVSIVSEGAVSALAIVTLGGF